jgi:pimeloyl-ACP methyl ester carboxylesterase
MRPIPEVPGITHRFVDAGGVTIHVAEAGDPAAPPVLLIHGWPNHWWMWREVMLGLADEYHVLAMDLRGCGWSEVTKSGYDKQQFADDALALLDAEGIDRVRLAGHDWGGHAAQLVAIEAPERVERLAVLNMAPAWIRFRDAAPSLHRFAYQVLMAAPMLGPAAQRSGAFAHALVRSGIPGDAAREYAANYKDRARSRAGSMIYRTFLTREAPVPGGVGRVPLGKLSVPTRVLFGKDDVAIRPRMLRGFTDRGIDIQFVENCGHFIVDEQPALVTQFLRDWFRSD